MSINFRNAQLSELYDFQYGTGNTIENIGGEYPIYGSNGIVGFTNKFNSEDAPVIGHIGAYAGIVNWANGKHYVTYNGVICKIKPNINPRFGYYALLNSKLQSRLRGSTQPFVSYDLLNEVKTYLPNRVVQDKIAKVLSDLDAKIELNNKINQELEAMAKTLYDYWFVQFDFPTPPSSTSGIVGKPYKSSGGKMVYNEELKREIPEGWEVKELGELGEFKNGVNYNPSNPGEIACPIINVRNISASSFFVQNEDLDIIYLSESDVRNYSVSEESIIIARSGIPGATRLISDIAKNTLYCGFAIQYELINLRNKIPIFFFLKSLEEHIKSGSGGTILKNVNQGILKALLICLPNNEELLIKFNRLIEPIFDKINNLKKQNQQLSSLRDWLLPMLMNGQVASRASATGESRASATEE